MQGPARRPPASIPTVRPPVPTGVPAMTRPLADRTRIWPRWIPPTPTFQVCGGYRPRGRLSSRRRPSSPNVSKPAGPHRGDLPPRRTPAGGLPAPAFAAGTRRIITDMRAACYARIPLSSPADPLCGRSGDAAAGFLRIGPHKARSRRALEHPPRCGIAAKHDQILAMPRRLADRLRQRPLVAVAHSVDEERVLPVLTPARPLVDVG